MPIATAPRALTRSPGFLPLVHSGTDVDERLRESVARHLSVLESSGRTPRLVSDVSSDDGSELSFASAMESTGQTRP